MSSMPASSENLNLTSLRAPRNVTSMAIDRLNGTPLMACMFAPARLEPAKSVIFWFFFLNV